MKEKIFPVITATAFLLFWQEGKKSILRGQQIRFFRQERKKYPLIIIYSLFLQEGKKTPLRKPHVYCFDKKEKTVLWSSNVHYFGKKQNSFFRLQHVHYFCQRGIFYITTHHNSNSWEQLPLSVKKSGVLWFIGQRNSAYFSFLKCQPNGR